MDHNGLGAPQRFFAAPKVFVPLPVEKFLPRRMPPPPQPTKPPAIRLTPEVRAKARALVDEAHAIIAARRAGETIEEIQRRLMIKAGDLPPGAAPESFVHKRLIGAVTGFIGGGPAGALAGFAGGGGRSRQVPSVTFTGANRGQGLGITAGCQPGFEFRNGRCERTGFRGAFERFAPGGRTGTQADFAGEAVAGGFNMPAFVPEVVGNISRIDGSSGPILRCPRGTVLATDDLCYAKGTRGLAAHRKWPRGTRPFLTGGDVKCLRRANTLRRSRGSKKLLKELGMG